MFWQVATRFLSASPPIYWFASYLLESPGKTSRRIVYFVWVYFLGYIFIGSLLFSNFYPFTWEAEIAANLHVFHRSEESWTDINASSHLELIYKVSLSCLVLNIIHSFWISSLAISIAEWKKEILFFWHHYINYQLKFRSFFLHWQIDDIDESILLFLVNMCRLLINLYDYLNSSV